MNTSIVNLLEAYPIPEQKETPPYKIYCDMDGVLTDFESRFDYFTGMTPKEYEKKQSLDAYINSQERVLKECKRVLKKNGSLFK